MLEIELDVSNLTISSDPVAAIYNAINSNWSSLGLTQENSSLRCTTFLPSNTGKRRAVAVVTPKATPALSYLFIYDRLNVMDYFQPEMLRGQYDPKLSDNIRMLGILSQSSDRPLPLSDFELTPLGLNLCGGWGTNWMLRSHIYAKLWQGSMIFNLIEGEEPEIPEPVDPEPPGPVDPEPTDPEPVVPGSGCSANDPGVLIPTDPYVFYIIACQTGFGIMSSHEDSPWGYYYRYYNDSDATEVIKPFNTTRHDFELATFGRFYVDMDGYAVKFDCDYPWPVEIEEINGDIEWNGWSENVVNYFYATDIGLIYGTNNGVFIMKTMDNEVVNSKLSDKAPYDVYVAGNSIGRTVIGIIYDYDYDTDNYRLEGFAYGPHASKWVAVFNAFVATLSFSVSEELYDIAITDKHLVIYRAGDIVEIYDISYDTTFRITRNQRNLPTEGYSLVTGRWGHIALMHQDAIHYLGDISNGEGGLTLCRHYDYLVAGNKYTLGVTPDNEVYAYGVLPEWREPVPPPKIIAVHSSYGGAVFEYDNGTMESVSAVDMNGVIDFKAPTHTQSFWQFAGAWAYLSINNEGKIQNHGFSEDYLALEGLPAKSVRCNHDHVYFVDDEGLKYFDYWLTEFHTLAVGDIKQHCCIYNESMEEMVGMAVVNGAWVAVGNNATWNQTVNAILADNLINYDRILHDVYMTRDHLVFDYNPGIVRYAMDWDYSTRSVVFTRTDVGTDGIPDDDIVKVDGRNGTIGLLDSVGNFYHFGASRFNDFWEEQPPFVDMAVCSVWLVLLTAGGGIYTRGNHPMRAYD